MDILNDLLDTNKPFRKNKVTDDKVLYRCGFCSAGSYNKETLAKHWDVCKERLKTRFLEENGRDN